MNVFLNLQGLIGGVRDDEICRENLPKLCEFPIDRLTETVRSAADRACRLLK